MKKILLVLIFGCLLGSLKAQGNLQFNRVVFIENSFLVPSNTSNPFIEQTITVPAGKVWKIESVMANYLNNALSTNPGYSGNVVILINKKTLYSGDLEAPFPIWLPAGSYTLRMAYNGNTSASINEVYGAISGIEFNITP